jgi:hypothetical protein
MSASETEAVGAALVAVFLAGAAAGAAPDAGVVAGTLAGGVGFAAGVGVAAGAAIELAGAETVGSALLFLDALLLAAVSVAGAATGALADADDFVAGVGAAAGSAIEPAGAEAVALALLFFDVFLLAVASVVGAAVELAAGADAVESDFLVFLDDFVPAAAVPEDASEEAADFWLLVEPLLAEPLLSDEVLLVDEDAAEVSVAEAVAFLDFVDFLVVVVAG